jgi:branched-chain amino acid transport system permease protein
MPEFILHVAIVSALYGIVAISLNLQAGVTGLLNFGQVAFFGIGAYATGIAVRAEVHPVIGLVAGMLVAALAGAALGRLGRTLAAEYWAISTLALAELFRLVILNEQWLANGPHGISSIPQVWGELSAQRPLLTLATAVAALVVSYFVARRLTRVQFGRVARLLREQPLLAASLGHDIVSVKTRIMAVSAAMAAVAGSLFAHYLSFIGPDQLLPVETFLVWAMIVVGGMGNHVGVLIGAVVVNIVFVGSRFMAEFVNLPPQNAASLRVLVIGAVLLAFLLFRTEGLVPERPRRI